MRNIGCAFVVFRSSALVSDLVHMSTSNFIKTLSISPSEQTKFNTSRWSIRKAPVESDIIWDGLYKKDFVSVIKKVVLISLLFIISVILVTPITVSLKISYQLIIILIIVIRYCKTISRQNQYLKNGKRRFASAGTLSIKRK